MTSFKVRDLRIKEKFFLDDAYLNGLAKYLDPFATAVYLSLCRHADKEQVAFPSQELIAKQHRIGTRTVRNKLTLLESWNIIKVERSRSPNGKFWHNTYFLVDKSEWKEPSAGDYQRQELPTAGDYQRQELPTKDTHNIHKKETHTSIERGGIVKGGERKRVNSTRSKNDLASRSKKVNNKFLEEMQDKFPALNVVEEWEKAKDYRDAHGKKYKNEQAFFRNWLRRVGDFKPRRGGGLVKIR